MNEKSPSLEEMLKKASQKLGTKPEELKNVAKNGNINNLLNNLGPEQSEKVKKILSDKKAASKLLSTPKAKELLKKFLGGK